MKILLLVNDFPPLNSIAAKRPEAWMNYLRSAGCDVKVIVTSAHPSKIRSNSSVFYFESRLTKPVPLSFLPRVLRKLRTACHLLFGFTIDGFDYFRLLNSFFAQTFLPWIPNIIIASGEPFILFKHARKIAKKHGIPWIADYRDNWSNEPTLDFHPLIRFLYGLHYRGIERKLLKDASLVTTVGSETAERIKQIHPLARIEIIPNGHSLDADFIAQKIHEDRLKIAYIGRLYKHRNPQIFLRGVSTWLSKYPDRKIEIIFYGLLDFEDQTAFILSLQPDINDVISPLASMPYPEMMRQASNANLLLMLADRNLPLTNGKMYDYLGLRRPILLAPDDKSFFNRFIKEMECGYIADNADEVSNMLEDLWHKRGNEQFFTTKLNPSEFSRVQSSKKLLQVIRELCAV